MNKRILKPLVTPLSNKKFRLRAEQSLVSKTKHLELWNSEKCKADEVASELNMSVSGKILSDITELVHEVFPDTLENKYNLRDTMYLILFNIKELFLCNKPLYKISLDVGGFEKLKIGLREYVSIL